MKIEIEKLTKEEQPLPLYYQLKEGLRKRIENKEFLPNALVPSEFQLISDYGVSRITVVKAISELVQEGLVYRKQGKGTFVREAKPNFNNKEVVGFIMPMTGHLFGPLSKAIVQGLSRYHYFPLLVDFSKDNKSRIKKIKSLLEREPAILLIDGLFDFPFHLLESYLGRQVIFVFRFEGTEKYSADYILSDFFEGGRLVAEHFISLGYKKIIFYTLPILYHKSQVQLISGQKEALLKNGLPEENLDIFTETGEEAILEKIKREKKPLAIFSGGDFHCQAIYRAARKLNLKIPQDIAIVGYFNTPWTEVFEPKLTSVSVREEEMAHIAVEKIVGGGKKKEKILLKPRLIIRDSCGAKQ
ncbi:MAG: GntR family transcriptional regulator [Candidatus Omnitrophota bacterium]